MEHLKRHNSVCVDPKDELLKAVIENKRSEIETIVKKNPGILEERYGGKYLKPILYIAIRDEPNVVTANTVSCLIEEGAPLNSIDHTWQAYQAIHFAVLGQNPSILKCIIKHYHEKLMDISVATKNGSTALHVLIKEGKPEREGFEECARILLENKLDYNATDERRSPPIYWAAKKGYKNIVALMLRYPNLDLDTYTYRNKTARDLIKDLNIANVVLPEKAHQEHNNNNNNVLLNYIKQGREEEFIALATQLDVVDDSMSEKSFLQYACEKYLLEVVRFLISKGVDKNRVSKMHPDSPVEIAAGRGYHLILALLIAQQDTSVSNNVLLNIVPKLDYDVTDKVDFKKCFELVMSSNKTINVNHRDKSGYYPLHYAARYGGPDTVLSLLSKKASLANRNAFDSLNICEIDYNTLKQHLDYCIEAVPDNRLDKESMTITFDYETLLPTKTDLPATEMYDEEKNLCEKKRYATPETDAVLFMSKSSELKTLLKHPLITSFLYVKWYRIRWIFYTNLIFYLIFLASLLLYIFAYYKESGERRYAIVYVFLSVTTGMLLVREVFQIVVGPKKYFTNFENYIEILLIGIVGFMLFKADAQPDTKTQAAAFAFLPAAFELLFLLGNYPGLSTNIVMLRTVSRNFFKFLCFYSVLIIAFAFCFHTLFKPYDAAGVSRNSTDLQAEDDDDRFFINPLISMFKTVIMLTGEFEAGELNFEHYPVTSHLTFLAFVMTIAIILLNLLNGLAVSDTQEIKNEAELVGHITRAEYIAYAESMLFSSFIPTKVRSWYTGIFPCQSNNKFKRLLSKPLTEKICIYPEYLKGFKLVIYPNQSGRVHFEDERNESCNSCSNLSLDKVTVRRTRALLHEKKEREKEESERQRVCDMQVEILRKLNELLGHRSTNN